MSVDIHSEEGQIIRQLIPLSTIPINQFESICKDITVEEAESGTFLFQKKDTANDLIYLIAGSITLQSNELKIETISSGTESSRFALAHQIPRKIDAFAITSVRFLRLKTNIIATHSKNSYEEDNSYMVIDEPEELDDDWMTTLLSSPIFRALPPANLQQIIMGLEEVSYKKGELIIKQGDPGEFYYLIKKGHCLLSRKPSANAKEIKLAQMHSKDTFGEDSLLSGAPRGVNITALTKITLLRLNKDKFISLIKEPTLKYIPHSKIQDEINNGATLIDVREPDEYKKHHLANSINAPFFSLRMQIKTFDKKKPVIIVCENGKISQASSFLLLRNNFDALIVEGGMENEPQKAISSTDSNNIDEGIETETVTENIVEPEDITDTQATVEISADEENLVQSLQKENQKLKQTIEKLTAEKDELENKFRALYKQSEKLKAVLDTLKIGGGSS